LPTRTLHEAMTVKPFRVYGMQRSLLCVVSGTIRGEPCLGRGSRHNLAFGDPSGSETMMQPCASAAGSGVAGPFSRSAKNSKGQVRVRITTTSDRYRQFVMRNERRNSLLLLLLPSN
jgi:2-methylaconitate cis-trans-isomerase PrpF